MRQINFRAWHEDLGEYKYMSIESFNFGSFRGLVDDLVGNDTATWEQYIGHRDKNDKEIYEGDIIKYVNSTGDVEYLVVKWSQEDASFVTGWVRVDYAVRKGEVVGNIHQNPELLEVS
ncbi:YopX family protein [Liquorilactobacillus mali]|nr:YopX family protein [Liquorilactobacillus mali]